MAAAVWDLRDFTQKSQSESVPFAFAYSVPGGKVELILIRQKLPFSSQLLSMLHSDFIFNLGVTAATWPSGDRQLASLASAQVPSQPHLPEADWEALFPFACETKGAPGRAVTQCDSFPSAKIGQPRPKLKMSAKTNSISKGPCVLPSLCSLVSSAKCCVSGLRRTPLNPTGV